MTINPYKNYSNTSADWFDLIPAHWARIRLRNIVGIRKIIAGTTGYEILSITQRGIKVKDIESNEGQLSMDYSKYQIVEPGDFAMNHMDLLTGYVDLSHQEGVTSPDYRVFRIKEDTEMNAIFLLRVLQNAYTQKILYAYGQGSSQLGRWRLPTDGFKNFEIPNPPSEEQEQIATFLDRETTKIDALIAEQERLIELLQEKRQAVISHAVTKGLNPNAPMKDSGVEWLGEVPEHWEIKPIKHLCLIKRGKFGHRPRNDPDFYDGAYPFIQTGNVTGTNKYITEFSQTLNEKGREVSQEFKAGTIAMAIAANVGDTAILNFDCYFPDSIVGLSPNQYIETDFLFYMLKAAKTEIMKSGTQNAQANVNVEQIGAVKSCQPPIQEQREICAELQKCSQEINDSINMSSKCIYLLQERRSALISAAVTGQIDVRGLIQEEEAA